MISGIRSPLKPVELRIFTLHLDSSVHKVERDNDTRRPVGIPLVVERLRQSETSECPLLCSHSKSIEQTLLLPASCLKLLLEICVANSFLIQLTRERVRHKTRGFKLSQIFRIKPNIAGNLGTHQRSGSLRLYFELTQPSHCGRRKNLAQSIDQTCFKLARRLHLFGLGKVA